MHRFFRSIRKSLILRRQGSEGQVNEGKTWRYLKYAVGEIILIVIGIFLALQLNNWNEGRKDRIEEREVLERIYDELQGHVERMATGGQGAPSRFEMIDRLISIFDGEPIEDNTAFLQEVMQVGNISIRKQVKSTYAELLSSGRFSLIQNVDLRNSIFEYYDRIDQTESGNDARRGDYAELVYKLIPRTGRNDLREGLSDEQYARVVQTVLNSDLRSHVLHERNRSEYTKWMFNTLTEFAKELQSKIEAELNQ